MENGFSNLSLTTSNQSISGSKDYKVQTLDFDTSCPCQITACDGGTLNVCCPVNFKKGFDWEGDVCDLDGIATFKGIIAQQSSGYNLVVDGATCATLGTSKTTNVIIGTIDTGDTTGNMSTRIQAQPTPSSVNKDGYMIVYHPDATHTPALNTGRSIEIVGGTGLNTDVLIHANGEFKSKMNISANADLTLYSRGTPITQGGAGGDLNLQSGYGQINMTAYGNGTSPGVHHDINIISQQGDIKITPKTPPLNGFPGLGYTYITGMVSTDQSIPVAPYYGPAGQIRICQEAVTGNVYLYASTLQFGTNAVQWSRILLV
jgi:hypothetical protein